MSETFNPGFPVHIYHPGMELPKEGTYFLVAGNGFWLHKDTGVVSGFVPVKGISVLEDLTAESHIKCDMPKIPARLVWRIKEFFRRVVQQYRAEACTVLYYNKESKEFRVHVPEQVVSHGGVSYRRVAVTHREGMEGFLAVGTIHSHCDFGAFHSGTDIGDEEFFDGLHCTFGHNDKDEFTISASLVMNGHRTKVDPLVYLEGILVRRPEHDVRGSGHVETGYYSLEEIEEQTKQQWEEGLDEWLEMVKPRSTAGGWFRQSMWSDPSVIRRGDKVAWAGDLKTVQLRTILGEGPFEVVGAEDGRIAVITNVGLARFSDKLFKKV